MAQVREARTSWTGTVEPDSSRPFDPLPPHSSEAEAGTLGSCLIDPEAIVIAAEIVTVADFYHPRNRDVFGAMFGLYHRKEPTDFILVMSELDRLGQLDRVGETYLAGLLSSVPTALHVEHYARLVRWKACARALISTAGRIAARGYEDVSSDESLFDSLAWCDQQLAQIRRRFQVSEPPVKRHLAPIWERYTA